MGFPERLDTIVSQVLAVTMPLSTARTSQRGSERTWALPSAWATSSRVLAAAFLSPFGTLLRDGWSAHVFSRARTRKYLRRHLQLEHFWERVGAHMAFPEFVDTFLDCSQALLLPTGVVQTAGSRMRMEAACCQEKTMDTLRALLSGTFLQRKDVVNQCLEFDLWTQFDSRLVQR